MPSCRTDLSPRAHDQPLMKQSQETLAATLKSLPMHVDDIEALLLTAYDYNIKDKHISGARAA